MSLRTFNLSFLSIKPKVWIEGDRLKARTSMLTQLLSLFSHSKLVVVDKRRKVIGIKSKYLWLINRERIIKFDEIRRLDYSFNSLTTSWSFFYGATDQMEKFTVSLCLYNFEDIKLFSFSGEGSVETGLGGVMFGKDSAIDYAGDQEAASGKYIDLLREFTGKPLTEPMG